MIEIKIELENAENIKKDKLTHTMGEVSIRLQGNATALSNELGIALYEIFMKNPDVVCNAINYATRHIDKHISKEEK